MPSSRYAGLFGAMLTLAGCAVQPQQSPGVHFVGDPQFAPRLSTDGRALRVAFAYNTDFMKGGMAGVVHDIESCYRKTTSLVGAPPDALRDCMTLDYTAYNIDQLDGRQINGAPLPFFTDNAVKARLAHYGPAAQFDSAAHMLAYLKDIHQLVQRHLVHDWKEQSGHCARNVTDPDCS
jgi:hypothetical protein